MYCTSIDVDRPKRVSRGGLHRVIEVGLFTFLLIVWREIFGGWFYMR